MHFPILPILITLAGSALAGMHPFSPTALNEYTY